MSQDVNQDWANRDFVESIEVGLRKCVDFLSDFHEQAKFRLSEVDQRLTSLERKVDFVEAQLTNADPSKRNAQPKSFKGSTFDPQVRREQVKKFRERLHKTEKVFSDRIIAPRKKDGARGKLIVGGAKQQPKSSQPQEILGAPKSQGKGNIPIAQAQQQMKQQKELQKQQSREQQAKQPPKSAVVMKSPPSQVGGGGPGGGPGGGGGKRPPPSAAQAQQAVKQKQPGPPQVPQIPQIPQIPQQAMKQQQQQPGPPQIPQQPKQPKQQPPPPIPKPPEMNEPGSGTGEGEGTYPTDGGPGAEPNFPHHDPGSIDLLIIKPGNGNVPGAKSKVEISYTGFLEDGSKFIEHKETISLGLKQNIKGLEAGVQRLQEGTVAKLWIPFKLGYGVRGAPPLIPGNSDLTFEITLIRIVE